MEAHALYRLTTSLYGKPHLISQSGFNAITTYLNARNDASLMKFDNQVKLESDDEDDGPAEGIGVIEINGNLTYKPIGMEALCGGCSYVSILDQAGELIDGGAETIIMNIRSPGGEAYGAFESAAELRQMCDDAGVMLYAYVDGSACSAAYAFACVADEVVANPYAEVGSIGVLIALMNNSEQLKKNGLVRSFITAGDSKVPFDDDGSFKADFLADLQTKVDTLYDAFASFVSDYTGMSVEAVKATEAKVYLGDDALKIGLVNKVMTRADFAAYVVSQK